MEAVNNALVAAGGEAPEDIAQLEHEDGTYTGTAEGHNGLIEVEVTVTEGEITAVEILDHSESADISDPAFEQVPTAIMTNNSTDVDVASGATVSSEAIMAAVENALTGSGSEEEEEASAPTSYTDGTYEGSAEGLGGPINLEVIVTNGEITGVTILDHSESEGYSDPAFEEVPAAIVENNSTDVDVASGATVSSEAIMAAVEDALSGAGEEEATAPANYTDGTYQGSGNGRNGLINLEVTITNGEITDITVHGHNETEGYSDPAFEEIPAAIIENNSIDVDVASGATLSSGGIIEAVQAALETATAAEDN